MIIVKYQGECPRQRWRDGERRWNRSLPRMEKKSFQGHATAKGSVVGTIGFDRQEVTKGVAGAGDGARYWARVVQDFQRGLVWMLYKIIEVEIDRLQSFFSKIFENVLEDSHWQWDDIMVVVRSLDRRVPVVDCQGDLDQSQARV